MLPRPYRGVLRNPTASVFSVYRRTSSPAPASHSSCPAKTRVDWRMKGREAPLERDVLTTASPPRSAKNDPPGQYRNSSKRNHGINPEARPGPSAPQRQGDTCRPTPKRSKSTSPSSRRSTPEAWRRHRRHPQLPLRRLRLQRARLPALGRRDAAARTATSTWCCLRSRRVLDFGRFSYDSITAEDDHVVALINVGVKGRSRCSRSRSTGSSIRARRDRSGSPTSSRPPSSQLIERNKKVGA